jgi:hypothetical protein
VSLSLQEGEDQLLLAHATPAFDTALGGYFGQAGNGFSLQFREVHLRSFNRV